MRKLPIVMVLGAVVAAACSADGADMMASMLRDAAQVLDDAGAGQAEASVDKPGDDDELEAGATAPSDASQQHRPPHEDLSATCGLEGNEPLGVSTVTTKYAYAELAVADIATIRSVYVCDRFMTATAACPPDTCGFRPPSADCMPANWSFTKGKVYVTCGALVNAVDNRYKTAHVIVAQ